MSEVIELMVVGEDVHEGWNYFSMSDLVEDSENALVDLPKYNAYRLFNTEDKGCDDISEIKFIGHEVIDDLSTEHDCEAELVWFVTDALTGEQTEQKEDLGVTVAYKTSSTPLLNDILPRYGAV